MLNILLAVIAATIVAVTSYMGVHVTMQPIKDPVRQERFKLAFIGLGMISVLLAAAIAYSGNVQIASLQSVVDARNRFFFYRAHFLGSAQPKSLIQLMTITSDEFDVSVDVLVASLDSGESQFLGEQKAPAGPRQGYPSGLVVRPGNYRIEFRGNAEWRALYDRLSPEQRVGADCVMMWLRDNASASTPTLDRGA